MKKVFAILSASLVIAIGGCGADDTPSASSRFATISWQGESPEPRIDPPDLPPPKKKTLVRDLRVGKGPVARKGDRVAVYYFGVSYKTGERVFSTWRPSDPWTMPLGAGVAWEKAIVGMRVGGRREMVIPSHLAFGEGAMIYIVDLVAVKPASEAKEARFGTITGREGQAKPRIHPPDGPPPKKPLVRDLEVGTGPVARSGDTITVHYVAVDYKTGKERYENWPPTKKPKPFSFELGSGGVSDAWEKAIVGMKVGGRRELIIPSELLFQNGTLDYVVELIRVKPPSQGLQQS